MIEWMTDSNGPLQCLGKEIEATSNWVVCEFARAHAVWYGKMPQKSQYF